MNDDNALEATSISPLQHNSLALPKEETETKLENIRVSTVLFQILKLSHVSISHS